MASVSTVVTMGFGSFGSVNLLPTLGYGIGAAQVIAEGIEFSLGDTAQLHYSLPQLPQFSEGEDNPEFSL